MANEIDNVLLLDKQATFTLAQVNRACLSCIDWVVKLVNQGLLIPISDYYAVWLFYGNSLMRILAVKQLQKNLEVNLL